MVRIHINGCVMFAPNIGVMVQQSALAFSGDQIKEMLALAYRHMDDEHLRDACHGCQGPLAELGDIDFDDYLRRLRQIEIDAATRVAKTRYSRIRRNQFSTQRADLILALIESGVSYVCAHPDCEETIDLTVDHKIPLSLGGTDSIQNLQFLCRSHNSKKGDHC